MYRESGVRRLEPEGVLLITIDTLRADRVGVYGHKAARTPTLDALAARGVRFADATGHAPLTHPAHAAIMTGRYPGAFGIRLNGMTPLPGNAVTLAERFKAAGHRTGAVVGSVILDEAYGLAQGFDAYDDRITAPSGDVALSELQRRADDVTDRALAWLAASAKASAGQGRWFLWVHYYDPHLPYEQNIVPGTSLQPYDAEVAYVDRELGRLLKAIDPARTLVAVTSDHGEALGDHGEDDHGYFIYDATLHVPLIVAGPGIAPRVVTEQVRSVDIAPTIVDLAVGQLEGWRVDGESLRPLINGSRRRDVPPSYAESWYPKLHFGWSELKALRVGEWKYVAAPKPELYDLRTDKGERTNVIADRGQVAARMAADLQKITAGFDGGTTAEQRAAPDPETIARLRALGYVGSLAPAAPATGGDDPKDRLEDYLAYRTQFNRALGLLSNTAGLPAEATGRRLSQAAALLQDLIKRNVRAYEAHLYLGQAYLAQKRFDAALGEFDASSLVNPSNAMPHFEAAKAFAAKGDVAAAVKRAGQGLALDPQSFYGHYTLGTIRLRANQPTEAAAALSRAVALNPDDPRARANLAESAMRLRSLDLAREQFEKLVDLGHRVAESHFNLGVIAEAKRDPAAARAHYRAALEANPRFEAARKALARLK